ASAADRDGQIRTPVTDGAHGKPWVYRYKDVKSWWSEQHFDRPGGTESATPTSWVPQSKPVWFMEIGCPAVDKGANQPNVFVDPKSSENALPYYSSGDRDDLMQRAYLSALMGAFDPDSEHYVAESNPASAIYAGRMVDTSRMYVYCWDARPFPAFPGNGDIWGDGANWRLGHWLNGRTSSVGLSALIERMMSDFEFSDFDARQLDGIVSGYVVDRVMSLRDALQPLTLGWFFDGAESGGTIVFRHRGGVSDIVDLTIDDLVEERADDPLLTLVRGQETEMPRSAKVAYIGGEDDYRQQVAESRRLIGGTIRVSQAELPVVLEAELAGRIADTWLHEIWSARERVTLSLPPSRLALEPGDAVRLETEAGTRLLRVTEVADRGSRRLEARSLDTSIYRAAPAAVRPGADPVEGVAGPALLHFVDLPLLRGDEKPEALYAAARQTPWAGGVAVYRSPEESGFALATIVTTPATIGETLSPLGLGPEGRMDLATRLIVRIAGEPLSSLTRLQMLSGRNAIAVRSSAGLWEVLQFESAELMAPETYELSGLLRGQAGTSDAMEAGAAAGSALVVLDEALASLPTTIDDIGLAYRWRYGPASRAIGDDSYAETVHASAGRGFKPYAPVHVRGWRDPVGAGDLQLTWVRRTRIGGDSWDVAEVPLGEEGEAYEVDILDGPTVVRTLSSSTAQVVYAASDQIDDFGAPQPSCQVRVYQMSGLLGRGCGRNATV
ncbi:MAG: glycoside hydrolase TIM-barrel-like domain-containing protein, partial [Hyphomicrobiaceae bacterium]